MKIALAHKTFLTAVSALFILTSCGTKERESFIAKKEADQIFENSEISDITNDNASSIHFFEESQLNKAKSDPQLSNFKLVLMSAKLKSLLSKISNTEAPDLKNYPIALMVYTSELKVFKVETNQYILEKMSHTQTASGDSAERFVEIKKKKTFTLRELKARKRMLKERDPEKLQEIIHELSDSRIAQASSEVMDLNLTLIASFKIDTQGHLDKQKTDYNEAKSAVTVVAGENPDLATHYKITGTRTDQKENAGAAAEKK